MLIALFVGCRIGIVLNECRLRSNGDFGGINCFWDDPSAMCVENNYLIASAVFSCGKWN